MTNITLVKQADIEKHLKVLSKIGNLGNSLEDGFLRASWSPEETRAMEYIKQEAQGVLDSVWDSIGNLYLRSKSNSDKPIVQVGSHLDTVPEGGNYDGVAGIIAGLEAICVLQDLELSKRLELVIWRGEESATFGEVYKGSRAAFGIANPNILQNTFQGKTLEKAIKEQGFDPELIKKGIPTLTTNDVDLISAHLELHIEQGRVLENTTTDIGIVTSIRGSERLRVIVTGEFDHSGNTPLGYNYRKDANLAIAYMQVRLNELVKDHLNQGRDLVQTVGIVNSDQDFNQKNNLVGVNALTKVSGYGYFTLDVRSNNNSYLEHYMKQVKYILGEVAEEQGVGIDVKKIGSSSALESLDEEIQHIIESAAGRAGCTSKRIASGAGHDATIVAKQLKSDGTHIPTGMIFIPCKDGKSHCKEEYASPEAITKGANVLMHTLYELAK